MNKFKEFFKNKRNAIIVAVVAVAVIAAVVALIVGCSGNEEPQKEPEDNSTAVTTEVTTADLATTDVESEATVTDETTDTEKTEESDKETSKKPDETKEPETTKAPETTACVHDYKKSETAPTCTNAGVVTYTCSKCGNSYTEAGKAATGHNWVAGQVVAPTETAQGYTVYTCSNCGNVVWDNYTPATGTTTTAAPQEDASEFGVTSKGYVIFGQGGGDPNCNHNWVETDEDHVPTDYEYPAHDECTKCGARRGYMIPALAWNGCNHAQHCVNNRMHNEVTKILTEGCPYCGKTTCGISFHVTDQGQAFYKYCDEYDIHKDSEYYCQVCGLPKGVGQGKCTGASWFMRDHYCSYCGEWVGNGNCHHCNNPLGNNYIELQYAYCQTCGKLYTNGLSNHKNSGECTG